MEEIGKIISYRSLCYSQLNTLLYMLIMELVTFSNFNFSFFAKLLLICCSFLSLAVVEVRVELRLRSL